MPWDVLTPLRLETLLGDNLLEFSIGIGFRALKGLEQKGADRTLILPESGLRLNAFRTSRKGVCQDAWGCLKYNKKGAYHTLILPKSGLRLSASRTSRKGVCQDALGCLKAERS